MSERYKRRHKSNTMESRKTRKRKKKKKGEVSEEQKVTLPMVKMDRNATSIFRYKFAYYVD